MHPPPCSGTRTGDPPKKSRAFGRWKAGALLLLLAFVLVRHRSAFRPVERQSRVPVPPTVPSSTSGNGRGKSTAPAIRPAELLPVFENELPNLIGQLSLPLPEERTRAAADLGRLGTAAQAAIPALRKLSKEDPDESVRRMAGQALLNIRGYAAPPKEF